MGVKRRAISGVRLLLGIMLGGLLAQAIQAQELPPPDAAYVDADPAAVRITPINAEDSAQRSALEAALRREPRSVPLRLQNAQHLVDRGLRARVPRELVAAERAAADDALARRTVHYNAGWIHYQLGDFDSAREQWAAAWRLHGGHPEWVPVAFALALWNQGDRETALAYYRAAVKARPERWASAEAIDGSAEPLGANARFALQSMRQAAEASR